MGNGAEIIHVPAEACVHKHILSNVCPTVGTVCSNFHGCLQNELTSLRERHLVQVDEPNAELLAAVSAWWLAKVPPMRLGMMSEKDVIKHKPPQLKKRTEQAFENIKQEGGVDSRGKQVTGFIKNEKAIDDEFEKPMIEAAPRLIQHRSNEYCARISQWLIPVEIRVWNWNASMERCPVRERIFAKSLNSFQRATRIVAMWKKFSDPIALLLDHSRFDAHLTLPLLERLEFDLYRKWIKDHRFHDLLEAQKKNRGKTRNGIIYKCPGRKMSGEYNTSLGDSLINAAMLLYWVRNVASETLIDGDDSVIVLERKDWKKLDPRFFGDMGMTTKVEYAEELEKIEFCQCRPVQISKGVWRMIRNPARVLSRTTFTEKKFLHERAWRDWITAVGVGELACNQGVPVLQHWAMQMILAADGRRKEKMINEILRRRDEPKLWHPVVVDPIARESFERAWDWPIAEQLRFEKVLIPKISITRAIEESIARVVGLRGAVKKGL